MRQDQRSNAQLRPVEILPGFILPAQGSCLVSCGQTRLICTATLENKVPPFRKDTGLGWLTAEYGMLPASTGRRKPREIGKPDGRSIEIQRLIGRSLRAAVDFALLGENSITIDCDVIQADGGTRTAAITGGFVALCLCIDKHLRQGTLSMSPIISQVAAVSCGLVDGQAMLDLAYVEDSSAQVDLNAVLTSRGEYIEVQGTGEHGTLSRTELMQLLDLAEVGAKQLFELQRQALCDILPQVLAEACL